MEINAILKVESDPLHSFYVSVIKGVMMNTRINDIAIAMSYSSRADPGLRVAFKYLNV